MKYINLSKALIVAILLLGVSIINAQPFRGIDARLADKLKLSDSQKEEIYKLQTDHQKTMIDLRSQLSKNIVDLRTAWRETNPSKKNIESLIDKISDIRSKMAKERANFHLNILSKLDDKQKKEFRELVPPAGPERLKILKDKRYKFFRGPLGGGRGPMWNGCIFFDDDDDDDLVTPGNK